MSTKRCVLQSRSSSPEEYGNANWRCVVSLLLHRTTFSFPASWLAHRSQEDNPVRTSLQKVLGMNDQEEGRQDRVPSPIASRSVPQLLAASLLYITAVAADSNSASALPSVWKSGTCG
jgi:hypothetical protein